MNENQPIPHSVGCEKSVLSTLIKEPEKADDAAQLSGEHFHLPGHRLIYSYIMDEIHGPDPVSPEGIDIMSIMQKLNEKGYPKGIDTLQEKEIEKEIDKKRKGTSDECAEYAAHIELPESDGHWFFDSMEACGWTRGGKPLKCWKSHMRAWKRAGHMASQKGMPVGAAGRDYTLLKDGTRIDGGIVIGGKLTTLRKA